MIPVFAWQWGWTDSALPDNLSDLAKGLREVKGKLDAGERNITSVYLETRSLDYSALYQVCIVSGFFHNKATGYQTTEVSSQTTLCYDITSTECVYIATISLYILSNSHLRITQSVLSTTPINVGRHSFFFLFSLTIVLVAQAHLWANSFCGVRQRAFHNVPQKK